MFAPRACSDPGWSAGLGHVGQVAHHAGLAAVSASFPLLYWAGRAHHDGHRLRQRVIVYDAATRTRRAVLDLPRHPIHELAFRPDGGALAIARGCYDGGHAFEGELLVWELASGAVRRPLAGNREVVRVRWIDATRLAVLVRPPDDSDGDDAFSQVHGALLVDRDARGRSDPRIGAEPVDPAAFGFTADHLADPLGWLAAGGVAPGTARPPIRDVARVGDRIAATDEMCLIDLWDRALRRCTRVTGEGVGEQILRVGDRWLVAAAAGSASLLYALDGDAPRMLRRFDRRYAFTSDARGHLLARDTGGAMARSDLVLDAEGRTLHAADLGHFDAFNHALRLDGGDRLHYLRGTPAGQHEHKVLAAISADGTITEVMRWDGDGAHHMDPSACMVDDGAIVAGYRVHHPHPGRGERYVVRRRRDGASEWTVEWPYAPRALAHAPAIDAVIVASLDGTLAALDLRTGALRGEAQLELDGVLAPPTCMVVEGLEATIGTLDGRLVTVSLA